MEELCAFLNLSRVILLDKMNIKIGIVFFKDNRLPFPFSPSLGHVVVTFIRFFYTQAGVDWLRGRMRNQGRSERESW